MESLLHFWKTFLGVNHTEKKQTLTESQKTFKTHLIIDLKLGYLKFPFPKTEFGSV